MPGIVQPAGGFFALPACCPFAVPADFSAVFRADVRYFARDPGRLGLMPGSTTAPLFLVVVTGAGVFAVFTLRR